MSLPPDINDKIAATVDRVMLAINTNHVEHGRAQLEFVQSDVRGHLMVLADGQAVPRKFAYTEIPVHEQSIITAARWLLFRVAEHGGGRVHFMLAPVHLINDDGSGPAHDGPDGFPVCRLRTIYYHEALAHRVAVTFDTELAP